MQLLSHYELNPSSNGSAVVSSYTCTTASAGTITVGVPVSSVTQTITATVTTVGTYSISTTANGVTFAASGTFTTLGAQTIVLTATGTPTAVGDNTFTLNTTPNCSFNRNGFVTATTCYANVNGITKDFLCHNLGADTTKDFKTYDVGTPDGSGGTLGWLYQWGRQTDGHQLRNSATQDITSTNPIAGKFITNTASPYDWINPQNINLWGDGTSGADPAKATNDPCPTGYKIPTPTQWRGLYKASGSGNPSLATNNIWKFTGNGFAIRPMGTADIDANITLYLPFAGYRFSDGIPPAATNGLTLVGTVGYYWSSRTSGLASNYLYLNQTNITPSVNQNRANGASIRCIKE